MSSENTPPKILVVDDTRSNVILLDQLLKAEGYGVISAYRGNVALQKAQSEFPDLILLDIAMPNMDGYEVCEQLKKDHRLKDVPVIFVSAFSETDEKVKALSVGGVDYITKPFQAEEVLARIAIHLKIRSLQKQLEAKNAALEAEINRRQRVERQLIRLAATDALTKVYNRRHFFELASKEYSRSKRAKKSLSIIMADIDHFKRVNDSFGHMVGDQVLVKFAQLLKDNLRVYDVLGRYGGEEFVILLPDTTIKQAAMIAERLRGKTEKTEMNINGQSISITVSFGVSIYNPKTDLPLEKILHRADQALYRSKQKGRNCISFWR